MSEHSAEKDAPTLDQYLARYMNNLYGTRTRVVEAVRVLLADAWREGYHHGVDDMTGTETLTVVRRNPYVLPPEGTDS